MHIKRVSVRNLHGIFTHKISFNDDYTFIHGINGTGKTSLLRAMQALLSVDLKWLIQTEFTSLSIGIKHNQEKIEFRIEKINLSDEPKSAIILKLRIGNERFIEEYPFEKIDRETVSRRFEYSEVPEYLEHTKELLARRFSSSEIINKMKSFPRPIFLGLERTISFDDGSDESSVLERRVFRKKVRTSQGTLHLGLTQAMELLQRYAQRNNQRVRILENDLRKKTSTLIFSDIGSSEGLYIDWPNSKSSLKYRRMKTDVLDTLDRIGVRDNDNIDSIRSFFDRIIALCRSLSKFEDLTDALEAETGSSSDVRRKALEWLNQSPIIRIIEKYSETIEKFNKSESKLWTKKNLYEGIMNSFFSDSGKLISLSLNGDISIMKSGQAFDIKNLSSGEKQIFVLMTQLIFNPDLDRASVLIIDEPEISLHVRWQEIFVKSIREANEKLQLVLATHSPSIVLDDIEKMVSLDVA